MNDGPLPLPLPPLGRASHGNSAILAMTAAPSRAQIYLQPRLKSLATSNTSQTASGSSKSPISRPDTPASRPNGRPLPADPLSEKATIFLIRRTLCSHLGDKGRSTPAPIDELLPSLTSSNEVDLQLYAFIAIIIKEFVYTWYGKITPDQVFVEEVVKIIAHCTRALEQRLRKVDLESLLFDELPELLDVHVQAYRTSHHPLHPGPVDTDPRQIYHSIWPSPALSPVPNERDERSSQSQMENEAAYRQLLVQGVLAVLLPTEDLENQCLTTLVGQIFSEMILGGGVGGKASEPWLLWEGITKVAEVIQAQLPKSKAQVRVDRSNSTPVGSVRFDRTEGGKKTSGIRWSIEKGFWLILQYAFLAFTAASFIIVSIATSSSLPSRIPPVVKITGSGFSTDHMEAPETIKSSSTSTVRGSTSFKQPILTMKLWSCVSSLLDLDTRMPWLSATISMLQWGALTGPGELGNTDGMLDKLLSHAIHTHVLDPSLLPTLLRTTRAALFPNNTMAPPRVIPSPAEGLLIRQRCASTLLSLIPAKMQEVYFGPGQDRRIKEVEEVLDIFGDSYCNKHLLYGVVELILVRLMPELTEKGIEELWEERLS